MPTITIDQALELARSYHRAGQLAAAEGLYRQVLAAAPQNAEAWHLLGIAALGQGRLAEAEGHMAHAVALAPGVGMYHCDLGAVRRFLGRFEGAVESFRQALAVQPDLAEAQNNLGEALVQLGRPAEAIPCLRRALELRPDFADAHNNLGMALAQNDQPAAAFAAFERALALNPQSASAHNNVGNTFLKMERWTEAVAAFDRAISLQPNFAGVHRTRGMALLEKTALAEAAAAFRRAIEGDGNDAEAHWLYGLLQLLLGHYEEGWPHYEWRPGGRSSEAVRRWEGSPAPGQTILVQAEQGLGDTLHFLRYLPLLRERSGAARVRLVAQSPLLALIGRNPFDGVEVITPAEEAPLPRDLQIPLLSLPLALRQFAPLPMSAPYLYADPARREVWRERLGKPQGQRIGLVWSGNRVHQRDRHRSISPERLVPVLRVPGCTFHSLQIEARGALPPVLAEAGLLDGTEHLTDFADTAAAMAELDLIITVDTAAAHLAGALGRPVWTLLPAVPDWRWSLEREDTPWYPTMRLFRQKTPGDWDDVVQRVATELMKL